MFGFMKKSSATPDLLPVVAVNSHAVVPAQTAQPQAAFLARVDKPQAETKTYYMNKTIPAVTYSTQYKLTTYQPETYTYVKPGVRIF